MCSNRPERWSAAARFQLVAAMNPCPCGHCGRVSGPLADRVDIKLEVPAPRDNDLMTPGATEAAHIAEAIQYQYCRLDASS